MMTYVGAEPTNLVSKLLHDIAVNRAMQLERDAKISAEVCLSVCVVSWNHFFGYWYWKPDFRQVFEWRFSLGSLFLFSFLFYLLNRICLRAIFPFCAFWEFMIVERCRLLIYFLNHWLLIFLWFVRNQFTCNITFFVLRSSNQSFESGFQIEI